MTDKISRRDFLRFASVGIGVGILATQVDPIHSIIYGPSVSDLPRKIPESLGGREIPFKNENLIPPDLIIKNGIETYNGWRFSKPDLAPLKYIPPENYLTIRRLDNDALDFLENGPDYSKGSQGLAWKLEDIVYRNDKPYSKFLSYAATSIDGPGSLVNLDPGQGFVKRVKKYLQVQFGNEYDPYEVIKDGGQLKPESE